MSFLGNVFRKLRRTPFGTQRRKVPILGVEASGKSSLILTLGQYISIKGMGRVSMNSSNLFGHYLSFVAKGEPLPATTRREAFELHIARIPDDAGGFREVDLVLSSEDIAGLDFRVLVDELRSNPNMDASGKNQGAQVLRQFTDLLSACDGFIFLVDLVRNTPLEEIHSGSRDFIWDAFADQIQPIMTGILLATKMNAHMAMKPIFFVFTKPDLHGLPPSEVREHFERGMAIALAQLRGELMNVRQYNVQCAGWNMDSALEGLGIDRLLADLVHALDGVENA